LLTTSQIGTATPGALVDVALSGQAAIVAMVTVGPIPCGQ